MFSPRVSQAIRARHITLRLEAYLNQHIITLHHHAIGLNMMEERRLSECVRTIEKTEHLYAATCVVHLEADAKNLPKFNADCERILEPNQSFRIS